MGLLDTLQSASNAIAGNVAGPVDILSLLLRKGGIPIPDEPVGGSEWMKRKGLMRDVEMGPSRIAGETLGLLAPTAIAAKAPQIARGLLQAQENAVAPRTLSPEAGVIVYHGSPHKFDKFDASKIGTGEGAQAYGHGIYLAESERVGKQYADALGGRDANVVNNAIQRLVHINGKDASKVRDALIQEGFPREKITPALESTLKRVILGTADDGTVSNAALKEYHALKELIPDSGTLYKADLPDAWLPKMLDWDKPLKEQSAEVQKALGKSWGDIDPYVGKSGEKLYLELSRPAMQSTPTAGASKGEASEWLRSAGIPGIRYLDGGSRGAGQGTSNYVVFPGLEDQIKILERNGVPLGLLGR